MDFIPLFSQMYPAQVNGRSILQKLAWFEHIGIDLSKNVLFVIYWILGARQIPAISYCDIFKIANWIPGLVFAEFLKPLCLCKEANQFLYKKLTKTVDT